jgi:predicted transcriptional regulator
MADERDSSTGKFTGNLSDEDFLSALSQNDVLGTADVAEEVGCTRQWAYECLKNLEERGLVSSKQVGRSLVWVRVDDA